MDWPGDSRTTIESIQIGQHRIRKGDRVRLRPRRRADIMDIALGGKIAQIDAIEEDFEHRLYVAVVVEDDPGAEWGIARQIAHRFFFGIDEIELLGE